MTVKNTMRNQILQLLGTLTLLGGVAQADSRPAVVELFTSQGCSSCPPADAFLGELAQRPDVLALAFHVDYWDGLGWRDRFDSAEATQRQERYATGLHLPGAFTPQVVIDGNRSFVGSNRHAIGAALHETRSGPAIKTQLTAGQLKIELDAQPLREPLEVILVAYLSQADTRIPRGENAGKTLREFNIVRAHRSLGLWSGEASNFEFPLAALPRDADHAAVLLQGAEQKEIRGAAAIALH
jgi:hypothetical protein